MTEQQVQEAAATGQTIELDAARAMVRLSPEQYKDIQPYIHSVASGKGFFAELPTEEDLANERSRIDELVDEEIRDKKIFTEEIENSKKMLAEAIADTEKVRRSGKVLKETPASIANNVAGLWARMARNLAARTGEKPVDILKRIRALSFAKRGVSGLPSGALAQTGTAVAERALQKDTKAWKGAVDKFISGALPKRKPVTMLNQAPLVLQMLGAKKGKVGTSYGALKKALVDKHKLPIETLKQVPAAMANPVMVFRSSTVGGDLILMLDLKDANGATVIVPVALEQTSNHDYIVNFVPSAYAKSGPQKGSINNQWFINQAAAGNLLYKNNKKSRDWLRASGLQLPGGVTNNGEGKIYTDAELVKLKKENSGMYQAGEKADGPKGALEVRDDQYMITLFKDADLSTLLHETGHIFLEELERIIRLELADTKTLEDYNALKEWWSRFN